MLSDVRTLEPSLSSAERTVCLETLEWGKLCSTPDGSIVAGAEHAVLGTSPGFPQTLAKVCQPDELGVSKSQLEEEAHHLFDQVPYGSGIRPVVAGDRILPIFFRCGVRPEASSPLGRRRNYSLARYLVDPTASTPPFTMFKTMQPLTGLTQEMAARLNPIHATVHNRIPEDLAPEPFLRRAISYLISGIQVHLRVGESEFFRLVDALWQILPPSLRPLLSAGWNVSGSVAAELAVFSSPYEFEGAGVFASGQWYAPSAPRSVLAIGEMYAASIFRSHEGEGNRLLGDWLESEPTHGSPAGELPTLPAFRDKNLVARFRQPGVALLEEAAVLRLHDWVEHGVPELTPLIPSLAGKLSQREEVEPYIRRAAKNHGMRRRAEQIAIAFIVAGGSGFRAEDATSQSEINRWHLFEAVINKKKELFLNAFLAATRTHETDEFPEEIVRGIRELFPQSLDQIECHFALMCEHTVSEVYSSWVQENLIDLAFAFAEDSEIAQMGLEQLRQFCEPDRYANRSLELLLDIVSGRRVAPSEFISPDEIWPDMTPRICALLETIWDQFRARRIDREILLERCRQFPSKCFSNPALKLASGGIIEGVQISALVKEIPALPDRLVPALSELALHSFIDLECYILEDPRAWEPLTSLWPEPVANALLGFRLAHFRRSEVADCLRLRQPFRPSALLIQRLIENWLVVQDPVRLPLLPQAAATIWDWIAQLEPPTSGALWAVDICGCLARGAFESKSTLSQTPPDQLSLAISTARLSGRYQLLVENSTALWNSATEGWQIKLMLDLFPRAEFFPSVGQLASLLPLRVWLRSHLERKDIASGRFDSFRIATYGFGEIPFPGTKSAAWREDWSGTALEAAFHGGPPLRVHLQDVFRAYASTSPEKVQICSKYISAAQPGEIEYALEKIVAEFFFAAVILAGLSKHTLAQIIRETGEPKTCRNIRVNCAGNAEPFEYQGRDHVSIADYMLPLIWLITNLGLTHLVLKFIDQNNA